jgi:hypothetical protein
MNTYNFKILVEALGKLPEELKNSRFDIGDTAIPNCGHRGCLAGLISIVAYDIYQLHDIYRRFVPFAGSFSHFIAPLDIDVHYFYFQKQSICRVLYANAQ